MTCRECREQIEAWLTKAMDEETAEARLPTSVMEHAGQCSACHARLEAARLVLRPESLRPAPPDHLTERITARLHEYHEQRDAARFAAPNRTHLKPARIIRFAAAAAVLVAVLFVGILVGRALPDDTVAAAPEVAAQQEPAAERTIRVEFRLEAPRASEVSVVGDWNGWDPSADPLDDRDGDGVWETTITLRPGSEYQYQFLIDDREWIPDPSSPLRVDDGFGGINSVLNI